MQGDQIIGKLQTVKNNPKLFLHENIKDKQIYFLHLKDEVLYEYLFPGCVLCTAKSWDTKIKKRSFALRHSLLSYKGIKI